MRLFINCRCFHLCGGGEKTEGAIDEIIRHTFTKASHLHFTMCEEYKKCNKNGREKKKEFLILVICQSI